MKILCMMGWHRWENPNIKRGKELIKKCKRCNKIQLGIPFIKFRSKVSNREQVIETRKFFRMLRNTGFVSGISEEKDLCKNCKFGLLAKTNIEFIICRRHAPKLFHRNDIDKDEWTQPHMDLDAYCGDHIYTVCPDIDKFYFEEGEE